MNHRRISAALSSLVTSGAMLLLAAAGALAGQDVPIVQPGAPGQKTTKLTAQQAVKLADARYTVDDVTFMRDMIHHHDQAVQMAELVKERTNLPELVAVAGRINASQADEIAFMQTWLRERGESVPDASMHRGMDMKGTMVGMASPADMARLATLKGADFDRLFLTLMIAHHDGALKMVDALVKKPGSAYDPVLFQFTSDVKSEQKAEIDRMSALLGTLATDPRVALKAGFKDAGQAASHLALVATLDKPTGFFDPANAADLPLPKVRRPRLSEPSPLPPTARPMTARNGATVPRCSRSRRPTWRSGAMCWSPAITTASTSTALPRRRRRPCSARWSVRADRAMSPSWAIS